MSAKEPLPRLPFVLLGAMTLASFGGPFVILFVVRGGKNALWPPDRPVEWVTIAVVFSLEIALFFACVSIGWWFRPVGTSNKPERATSITNGASKNIVINRESIG